MRRNHRLGLRSLNPELEPAPLSLFALDDHFALELEQRVVVNFAHYEVHRAAGVGEVADRLDKVVPVYVRELKLALRCTR